MGELVPITTNVEAYRASTDAATICKDIVVKTATVIQGRKYVGVEGWQAIAIAHGCSAGSRDVERVEGGVRAIGEVRRMMDGTVIATAEGFVGEDEPTWYGGIMRGKTLPKRADYAIRAMAQTRAISRACRSAFAHVVVMMNAGLATTPAEEVPDGGFNDNTPSHDPETGEIIEATPEPRAPVPGITKIKERLRLMMTAGDAPDITLEGFRKLKRDNREDLKTIRDANHGWWTGDGEDFEGFGPWMDRRLAELAEPAEDGMFKMLIDSMKTCDTKVSLENWFGTNEALIEGLDDAERRKFDLAYELHESGIQAMDRVTAGA
jgi:hypothetical protein